MKNIFSLKTANGRWWKGEFKVKYNLLLLLRLLLKIIILPFLLLAWLLKKIWQGLRWLWDNIAPFIGCLGVLIFVFWEWLKGLFKRKPKVHIERTEEEKLGRNLLSYIGVLLFLLLFACFLFWRSCSDEEEDLKISRVLIEDVYNESFDDVVIARAYLDGVQDDISHSNCPRGLVGLKFINDKPVEEYDFNGMTYDEAVKIVATDWRPLVLDNLSPDIRLSEQQMVVITLTAMRMGKNGFPRSTFLEKVNEGKFDEATKWLLLQKRDGEIRKTKDEPKQYFYVLRLLWEEQIQVKELMDLPMFSYKATPINVMYDKDGQHVFNDSIKQMLKKGSQTTPRKALKL